mgnify:FL=1
MQPTKQQIVSCNLCEKDIKGFDGCVWYSGDYSTELCRDCYQKWLKNKECNLLEIKHRKAKPTTKAWQKKCDELQKAFDRWYSPNGGK